MYALTQTFRKSAWSVDGAPHSENTVPTAYVNYASWVFHPPTRIHVGLLGPCFKTGRLGAFCQHPDVAVPEDRATLAPWSNKRHRRGDKPRCFPVRQTHAGQHRVHATPRERRVSLGATTAPNRFPHNNFKHFLTLFSKFFSSFPHGTCSLSVSRQYLGLGGIHLPFRAAFSSNPTLGKRLVKRQARTRRGFHPLGRWFPPDLGSRCHRDASLDYNSPKRFSSWPIPGSLAVTRGILVSFFSSAY